MAVNNNFPRLPPSLRKDEQNLRLIAQAVNSVVDGKMNCTGEVTLTASTTTTAVTNNLCNANSVILLQPITANAAAAIGTTYIVAATGSFTVTHANNAQTDRNFKYVLIG